MARHYVPEAALCEGRKWSGIKLSTEAEKLLHLLDVGGSSVSWQAFYEHFSVLLLQNAVVQQHQQAAIMQRPDQASETLFQGNHSRGHLVLKKGIAAVGIDGLHSRRDYGVAGHGEWQAVDDHATELLALHVYALPER